MVTCVHIAPKLDCNSVMDTLNHGKLLACTLYHLFNFDVKTKANTLDQEKLKLAVKNLQFIISNDEDPKRVVEMFHNIAPDCVHLVIKVEEEEIRQHLQLVKLEIDKLISIGVVKSYVQPMGDVQEIAKKWCEATAQMVVANNETVTHLDKMLKMFRTQMKAGVFH